MVQSALIDDFMFIGNNLPLINLTNFMDGIDGLAASSGVLIMTAVGAFAWLHGDTELCIACAAVSGSVTGFLPWNLSRTRRIFMGDDACIPVHAGLQLGARVCAESLEWEAV